MPTKKWIWRCDRVIPSDTGLGRRILDELVEQMKARQWSTHDIYSVRLAVEEALVNAIMHGNRCDADKCVQIRCRLAAELVRIEIIDEGGGFDLGKVPNPTNPDRIECPCGRGVMLIRAFMTRVKYNMAGNGLVMVKERAST